MLRSWRAVASCMGETQCLPACLHDAASMHDLS
jgi:hypothetical protein